MKLLKMNLRSNSRSNSNYRLKKTIKNLRQEEMSTLSACSKMLLDIRPCKNSNNKKVESSVTLRLPSTRSILRRSIKSRKIIKTLLPLRKKKLQTWSKRSSLCSETTTKRCSKLRMMLRKSKRKFSPKTMLQESKSNR